MKKHIIVALGDYYPRPSANGVCIESISAALIESGYAVDIVSNRITKNLNNIKTGNTSICFVELPFIQQISEKIPEEKNPGLRVVLLVAKAILSMRFPVLMITYPITSIFRTLSFARRINHIIKENEVVAIIGVHKPMEAIYGAFLSAKRNGIPFFGYYLDPLVNGYSQKYLSPQKVYNQSLRYEKELVLNSRKSIFMNSHYNDVIKRYQDDQRKKLIFLGPPLLKDYKSNNGLSEDETIKEKKIVVYAGSLYKDIRNPKYIMEVFKYVRSAKLVMYVPNPEEWLFEDANQNVEIHNGLSHQEIIGIMNSCDALLNIGNSTPLFIPSKIIECMGVGKPIISTYNIDNDPCLPYMDKYPHSICLDEREHSVQESANLIDGFLRQEFKGIPFEKIKKEFYINTPEAFCEVVHENI